MKYDNEFLGFFDDIGEVELPKELTEEHTLLKIKLKCRPGIDINESTGKKYGLDSYKRAMNELRGEKFLLGTGSPFAEGLTDDHHKQFLKSYLTGCIIGNVIFVTTDAAYVIIHPDGPRNVIADDLRHICIRFISRVGNPITDDGELIVFEMKPLAYVSYNKDLREDK